MLSRLGPEVDRVIEERLARTLDTVLGHALDSVRAELTVSVTPDGARGGGGLRGARAALRSHRPEVVMDKSFDPAAIEQRWYQRWESAGYFAPRRATAPPYCIQLPPPNVTGTLHMGHAFQHTLMDTLIRYHRMRGATPTVAAGHRPCRHRDADGGRAPARAPKAQTRPDLGREQFIERVWEWKQQSGGTITRQMRRLGASVDWSRETRLLHDGRGSVARGHRSFVRLHERRPDLSRQAAGELGPGAAAPRSPTSRCDTRKKTARSGTSAIRSSDGSGHVVVATTRPETMLGDAAVAVHPDDERYRHLVGKQRRAAAHRPHDPGHRRRLRRSASSAPAA